MNNIRKNFFYNVLYRFFSLLTPVIVTPYITRTIEQGLLGYNTLIGVSVSYFCIMGTLGMSYLGPKEIASNKQKGDGYVYIVFQKLISSQLLCYLCVMIFYIFYAYFFCHNIGLMLAYSFQILAAAIDISWLFQGLEEFKYISIRNILVRIVSTLLIFLLVKYPDQISIYVLCLYIPQFIFNCLMWGWVIKKYNLNKFSFVFDIGLLKKSMMLAIPTVAISIYTMLDKTILGLYRENTEVAIYDQGQILLSVVMSVVPAISTVVMPRMSNLISIDASVEIERIIQKTSCFIWFISFGLMFAVLVCADQFIDWYLPYDYQDVKEVLRLSAILVVIVGAENIIGIQLLIPFNHERQYTISLVGAAIVNVLLDLIFIPYYGMKAACICSVIGEFCGLILQSFFARKITDIKTIYMNAAFFMISSSFIFSFLNVYIMKYVKYFSLGVVVSFVVYCFAGFWGYKYIIYNNGGDK